MWPIEGSSTFHPFRGEDLFFIANYKHCTPPGWTQAESYLDTECPNSSYPPLGVRMSGLLWEVPTGWHSMRSSPMCFSKKFWRRRS